MPDVVMEEIRKAQELNIAGDRAGARAALEFLWETTQDALHRCTIAHYLADLQDSVEDELRWDELALAAFPDLTDEGTRAFDDTWRARAFLPSLHLNLADAHRRAGHEKQARHFLGEAVAALDELPVDDYGAMIRDALGKVREAIEAGSTASLVPAT
ncbi:hypothetical protein Aph02nite_23120 [Actinoplanes philippinensis]|uniref:Tetratricopeptide repeat-containing protein n=1 Tax=Actinoplanes philippinensis TaxID=35752 RepID=A0A1I2MBZ0_9ACTN|nr:hypothetical protein [Actinoplanes philippinensis]GIE76362.1 hypothetical protein Aph02nite_23120 [Actinoplanes philippinensis]SFF88983.1 hypothetical protein SAMN05421541_12829 [Actinoplanes philippinensis]